MTNDERPKHEGMRTLRESCSVVRLPPLNYYEQDQDALSYLVLRDAWGPVVLHDLEGVYVSPYGVLYRDGRVLPESLDYSHAGQRHVPSFVKKIALGRAREVPGTCVVAHNVWFKNYYHWLLEALPRIFCVRDHIRDAKLILCADVEPFHLQTLKCFDFSEIVLLKRSELILAEHLRFPSPAYGAYGQHRPDLLREMSEWMKCRVGCTPTDTRRRRRLYVGRGSGKRRQIANERELVSLLGSHGFESVLLENVAFNEQVRMFSEAEAIAGIHGAGLSNMLFMNPGGVVLEFVNERYRDGCLFNLASACGHRTVVSPCRLAGPTDESGPKYYDMEVDIEKTRRYLEWVESASPASGLPPAYGIEKRPFGGRSEAVPISEQDL
jgi:capsular polysaccharide biosynthesis protein